MVLQVLDGSAAADRCVVIGQVERTGMLSFDLPLALPRIAKDALDVRLELTVGVTTYPLDADWPAEANQAETAEPGTGAHHARKNWSTSLIREAARR